MERVGQRILSSELFWTGLSLLLMAGACAVVATGLLTLSPVLMTAGVLAFLGCALVLYNPYWGALLFLSLLYVRPEQFFPQVAPLRLPFLISAVTLFGWGLHLLVRKETFRWRTELGWMIAFALSIVLSGFYVRGSDGLPNAIMDSLRLLLVFVMLQQLLNGERRVHAAVNWLLAMTVVLSLYGIRSYFTGTGLNEHGTMRALVNVGDFDDPNDLAAALVIAVPIALLLLLRGRTRPARLGGGVALGILLLGIYLCNSRGGMLALGVGTGIFLIYQLGWTRGCVLAGVALVLMLLFGPDRFSPQTLGGDESSQGRVLAWQAGLTMFEGSRFLGVGYDQFEEHHEIPAHNSFIHALGEGGLLTALTWVGLNYWVMLMLGRVRRSREEDGTTEMQRAYAVALMAGLAASLAAQMFLSHTFRPVPLLPVALASAVAALGGTPRARWNDWIHYLAVAGITVGGIGLMYLLVVILL